MDSFNISNIRLEKANALKKHRQLQKLANMFRLVEILLVLALISRFTIKLPVAVKNSSDYFKDLTVTLVSPRFVFVIGNAIVIILFAKSGHGGHHHHQDSSGKKKPKAADIDLYEEFVEKSSEKGNRYEVDHYRQKKQSTSDNLQLATAVMTDPPVVALEKKTNYQRSQSENLSRLPKCNNKPSSALRRTVTEISCKKGVNGTAGDQGLMMKKTFPEDKMSNEEFRCTIEAFIARQKQFRRVEEEKTLMY